MKLISAIATAAVIGAAFVTAALPALAQCRNGWCKAGCFSDGTCQYVKVFERDYPYVKYLVKTSNEMNRIKGDCQQYTYKYLEIDGNSISEDEYEWTQAMPGSAGEKKLELACNM